MAKKTLQVLRPLDFPLSKVQHEIPAPPPQNILGVLLPSNFALTPAPLFIRSYYAHNYDELKMLNPGFPLLLRTAENTMPAITTDLEWTTQDVVRFMIQTGRFRQPDGSIAQSRVEAAQAWLQTDWDKMLVARFKSPGFDPERPGLDKEEPEWKDDPVRKADLAEYFDMRKTADDLEAEFKSGPNDEYVRAENALLMCQRVDLWCAGTKEVERAVQHLYKLGRAVNQREVEYPSFIAEFIPGADDIRDS
jgi:hypothetical protein